MGVVPFTVKPTDLLIKVFMSHPHDLRSCWLRGSRSKGKNVSTMRCNSNFTAWKLRMPPGYIRLCCCCWVANLCPSLCNPMYGSMPGFPGPSPSQQALHASELLGKADSCYTVQVADTDYHKVTGSSLQWEWGRVCLEYRIFPRMPLSIIMSYN